MATRRYLVYYGDATMPEAFTRWQFAQEFIKTCLDMDRSIRGVTVERDHGGGLSPWGKPAKEKTS